MADMYDRMRAMTIRNLKPRSNGGRGLEGILKRTEENVYNPDTDMNETTVVEYNISGIRANYSTFSTDGTLIRDTDSKFYLCPIQIDGSDCPIPLTIDRLEWNGKDYVIINVKEWDYAGTSCGWLLQIRGV